MSMSSSENFFSLVPNDSFQNRKNIIFTDPRGNLIDPKELEKSGYKVVTFELNTKP